MPHTNVRSEWVDGDLYFYDKSNNEIFHIDGTNRALVLPSGATFTCASLGISTTELGLLDGATAASITASKVVTRDAGKRIPFETAVPAAAGNSAGTATALTADVNLVTASDGTTGVILPTGVAGMRIEIVNTVTTATAVLKVYPDTGGAINGGSANASVNVAPGERATFVCTAALTWYVAANTAKSMVAGVAAGYKIARGTVTLDGGNPTTAATGLTTIVTAVVGLKQTAAPGDDPSWLSHNYTGSDGNLDIYAWKNTGGTDPTLVASTNSSATIDWIAIGT